MAELVAALYPLLFWGALVCMCIIWLVSVVRSVFFSKKPWPVFRGIGSALAGVCVALSVSAWLSSVPLGLFAGSLVGGYITADWGRSSA